MKPELSQEDRKLMSWLREQCQVINPCEYSGLISFRNDWFDFLTVQGTLKSLLQHHNSETSILGCSAFIMVQLSHLYMTTGKSIALTSQNLVIEMSFASVDASKI